MSAWSGKFSRISSPRFGLTELELCSWLGSAQAGEALEYHRGFLAIDVAREHPGLPSARRAELRRVARRAHWAAEQRLVHLVQQRHGLGDYSYFAIRCRQPSRSGPTSQVLAERRAESILTLLRAGMIPELAA